MDADKYGVELDKIMLVPEAVRLRAERSYFYGHSHKV